MKLSLANGECLLKTFQYLLTVAVFIATTSVSAQTSEPPELPEFDREQPSHYGRQLMDYADRFDAGWVDEVLQGKMTLVDAAGRSVTRSFVRMGLEQLEAGDKILTRFTAPNDIRGVAALTFENSGASDDNWLYLPATKRARRISGANNTSSFQGTEFTYEDLTSLDPDEYEFDFVREETISVDGAELATHTIEGVPTYNDTGYSRLLIHLDPKTWTLVRIDYFDLAGTLLKTRTSTQWKAFHDRFWRAQRIEMVNHQTGKRTTLEIGAHYLDLSLYKDSRTGDPRKSLTEAQFTTRALVK